MSLSKREKVLVQYRLLKDFVDVSDRGIPGIDIRVMEHNIYEWHVTMSPLSGHFAGLRVHLILLFPEDYPRKPPKVEVCNMLPHTNVFQDFMAWQGYWFGYKAIRGKYVICTNFLEQITDESRYEGWSVAYGVEAVLVQLQCLLFDDYVHLDTGDYAHTLWDDFCGQRYSQSRVRQGLYAAQKEADEYCCSECGYDAYFDRKCFYDKPFDVNDLSDDDDEEEEDNEEAEEKVAQDPNSEEKATTEPEKKKKMLSRKKQTKMKLRGLVKAGEKVDFKKQNAFLEVANANSALISGHALRRIPGVYQTRDVISFYFHGVEDPVYSNGCRNINKDLTVWNYGHETQFPWLSYDIMTGKMVRKPQKTPEEEEKKVNKNKVAYEKFVNSQGGGSKLKPEDTPGNPEYIRKREVLHKVGVIESVWPDNGTVDIVVAGEDGQFGRAGLLTRKGGRFAWNSEGSGKSTCTLYKGVPMEKVVPQDKGNHVVPYLHEPPKKYKPTVGHYEPAELLEYNIEKDMPTQIMMFDGKSTGLTKKKLKELPEDPPVTSAAPAPSNGKQTEGSFEMIDGRATEQSFELVSAFGDGESSFEVLPSYGGVTVSSFDIVSVLEGDRGSVASSFHIVPSALCFDIFTQGSSVGVEEAVASLDEQHGSDDSKSVASSQVLSSNSVMSLRTPGVSVNASDLNNSWELLKALSTVNVPLRGLLRSLQNFGAFISIDGTPRNLRIQNQRVLPSRNQGRSKGSGRGKGKGKDADRVLADGMLPCLPYMRSFWPTSASQVEPSGKNSSVMYLGNIFEDLAQKEDDLGGPPQVVVYVNEVDSARKRLKFSLQPWVSFEDVAVGSEYTGIVVDASKQSTLGLFVSISDDLVGLLHRSHLSFGDYSDEWTEEGEWKRSVYRVGDRMRVWVLRKEFVQNAENPRRRFKIDFTLDPSNREVSQVHRDQFLQILDEHACDKNVPSAAPADGKTAIDLQLAETYNKDDKFYLINNNRLIINAANQYPEPVIDYTTDPPPPPTPAAEKKFDFSLIEGWTVKQIIDDHERLRNKNEQILEAQKDKTKTMPKPLSKEEERLWTVLQKKTEEWGNEYYEKVKKKVDYFHEQRKKFEDAIKAERDKYPHKSIIDREKFMELSEEIKKKNYDLRTCFVTRLSYKEDVLGVGLSIVPDEGRNVFHCAFDLLSKEAFVNFSIRNGVWREKISFWMPAAIDASHFRRALPYLANTFKDLGDGRVEELTRSFGTQAGANMNVFARQREAERKGKHLMSLDEYRKEQAERRKKAHLHPTASEQPDSSAASAPTPSPEVPAGSNEAVPASTPLPSAVSLTEEDMSFGLDVLPKLMNLQTVQLMKGDLHLSTKALEGYMGFHHLLLSILRQFPKLQTKAEQKIERFLRDETLREKKACPNIGEFLCLFAVSRKYTWDDASRLVFKETLDRNAGWAIDKHNILAAFGVNPEVRLEKTFKGSIVSIRLLCFNVWFLRNIVFKKYGKDESVESILAQKASGEQKNLVDKRWEEYEKRKGIPQPHEVEALQEEMKKVMHSDGLNSWSDYFVRLNIKPLKPRALADLLFMCLTDATRKGYIPLWKLRSIRLKLETAKYKKVAHKDDHMGHDVDKYDDMFHKPEHY